MANKTLGGTVSELNNIHDALTEAYQTAYDQWRAMEANEEGDLPPQLAESLERLTDRIGASIALTSEFVIPAFDTYVKAKGKAAKQASNAEKRAQAKAARRV